MEKEIYFTTSDNLKLYGVMVTPRSKTDICVIMCHGITVDHNESDNAFLNLANKLKSIGIASFRFDFRAHGKSQGDYTQFSPSGEVIDLETAYRLIRKRYHFNKIILLGASFAGGVVSIFSAKHKVHGIVFWNPTIDYKKAFLHPSLPWTKKYFGKKALLDIKKYGSAYIGSRKFKVGKFLFDDVKKINPEQALYFLSIPILFIHGDKDEYASLEDVLVYSKKIENADLIIIKNGRHGLHNNPQEARETDEETIKFIKRILRMS